MADGKARLRYQVLGGVAIVSADNTAQSLAGDKQRRLLAALLMSPGRSVSADLLAEAMWGDAQPGGATAALHVHVSKLRQTLASRGAGDALKTSANGYQLQAELDDVDHVRFSRLVRRGTELLGAGDARAAGSMYAEALDLWVGAPFADLADASFAAGLITSLERERAVASRGVAEAALASGRADVAVQQLEPMAAADPYDEGLQGLLMLALARVGRATDALQRYDAIRDRLLDELGTDPGPELQALHLRLLRQDPTLLTGPTAVLVGETVARPRAGGQVSALLDLGDRQVPLVRPVTTLGRAPDRAVALVDAEASREHATIARRGDSFVLTDSGSTNGTMVNDVLVDEHVLNDGDRIQIGATLMSFRVASSPAKAEPDQGSGGGVSGV